MLVALPRWLPCPYMVKKTLKIFVPGISRLISTKLVMKHQRLKPNIFCSNDNPGFTFTYFTAQYQFAITLLYGKCNVTMMDSLEIIASCDLELGLYRRIMSYQDQCQGLLSHFNQVLYVSCLYQTQISGPLVLWFHFFAY